MSDDDREFADLVRRVRAGDAGAIEELVRRYEPVVRLEVRARVRDPRLRDLLDASGICNAVLASFCARAAAGQFDLDRPENLVKLLAGMARNKVAHQARKHRARRRDYRRNEAVDPGGVGAASPDPSPSRQAAAGELLREFRRRLTDEERAVADRWARGQGWAEIAAELGGTPEGRRKQHARAVDRVSRELGLDEPGEP